MYVLNFIQLKINIICLVQSIDHKLSGKEILCQMLFIHISIELNEPSERKLRYILNECEVKSLEINTIIVNQTYLGKNRTQCVRYFKSRVFA